MTDMQTQMELEELFDKHQLMPRLRKEYDVPEIREVCTENNLPVPFVLDMLASLMLHKRANVSTMVGLLKKHFDSMQEVADMLFSACEAGLMFWDDRTDVFVVKIEINAEIMRDLDKFQFPLPLVIPPKPVMNNRQTGYYSHVSGKGSIILKNNHHEDDVCLDHINRMNGVKLSLNTDVVHFVKNKWKNLDRPKEGESFADFKTRQRAFEKYDKTSKDVVDAIIVQGNEMYLTHKYDKRGRTYAVGYHVNPQGNAWNKACINFAEGEIIDGF
jgi:hypothetical protein